MQPASRAALSSVRDRLDARIAEAGADLVQRLGEELGSVAAILAGEVAVRRHLADPSTPVEVRTGMLESLLGAKVDAATLDTLVDVVSARWSRPLDLVDAVQELSRRALLVLAERDGSLSEVEDELFRFGRILDAQRRLEVLLSQETVPVQRRIELLDTLVADRVRPVTRLLLEQAVSAPRKRPLDEIVEELVDRAAAQRERSVAHVSAGGPLSEAQQQRLLDTLSRIYRRPISLKVELEPELLGGLVIRVGDEVIDGSVVTRLQKAHQWLPR